MSERYSVASEASDTIDPGLDVRAESRSKKDCGSGEKSSSGPEVSVEGDLDKAIIVENS